MKKIFVIAGEESGDLIGGDLLRQIKQSYPEAQITGIGGEQMQVAGQFQSIFPLSDLSVMGLAEVIRHLPRLLDRMTQTKQAMQIFQPDLVLTIDAPDFSLRMAKWAKRHIPHVKTIHTVAPTVWAWRPGRAQKIAQFLNGLLCLFPFEPPYFTVHGLDATFIGHPLVQMIEPLTTHKQTDFLSKYSLHADHPVLCVLPGSRVREIEALMPVFLQTITDLKRQMPDLQVILPTLPRLQNLVQDYLTDYDVPVTMITDIADKYTAMQISTAALHASGTVALELALCHVPMVTAYQVSPLSAWLARRLLKINSVNLVNILLGEGTVPEYLQEDCTTGNLVNALEPLLQNGPQAQQQRQALQELNKKLQASQPAVDFIKKYL